MIPPKLIILDRDGTINEDSVDYIKSAAEWEALPGALEAMARLTHAGWRIVIASNQSGLGRGLFEVSDLNAIQAKLCQQLSALGGRVDAFFYCPHTPADACTCRKPAAGLFEQIAERYGVTLAGVPAVGDSERDLVAAAALGCEPHLVLTGKSHGLCEQSLPFTLPEGTRVHQDLSAVADFLLLREIEST